MNTGLFPCPVPLAVGAACDGPCAVFSGHCGPIMGFRLGESSTLATCFGVLAVCASFFSGAGFDFSLKYRFNCHANHVKPATQSPMTKASYAPIPPALSNTLTPTKI